jgi:hypothetical protein
MNKNDDTWFPKFTVIVAQKNHHTRFFRDDNNTANVPAGNLDVLLNLVWYPQKLCPHPEVPMQVLLWTRESATPETMISTCVLMPAGL